MWDRSATSDTKDHSPLGEMADHNARVVQICDLLEAMADDLPRRPVPVWREAARMCEEVVKRHYKLVLDVLLPVLEARTLGEEDCEDVLRRVHADFEDEASKLLELNALMLDTVGDSAGKIEPEALGYALRCFFVALRRNASWEADVLLPLARRRLNIDDLDMLRRLMQMDANIKPA